RAKSWVVGERVRPARAAHRQVRRGRESGGRGDVDARSGTVASDVREEESRRPAGAARRRRILDAHRSRLRPAARRYAPVTRIESDVDLAVKLAGDPFEPIGGLKRDRAESQPPGAGA